MECHKYNGVLSQFEPDQWYPYVCAIFAKVSSIA